MAIFIEFYKVASGPRFFNQDPRLEPKGQPKGQKRTCLTSGKTQSDFLLNFTRSHQDLTFSTRTQEGNPSDHQSDKNRKCRTGKKALASFIEFYEVMQGYPSFHQEPGWEPKKQPKGQKK